MRSTRSPTMVIGSDAWSTVQCDQGIRRVILSRFWPPTVPAQSSKKLIRLIAEFAETQTLDAARRRLRAHPEILSSEADALLAQQIARRGRQVGDSGVFDLELRRIILRRCREVGVEQALRELTPLLGDRSPGLRGLHDASSAIATRADSAIWMME